ncbi:MAG TPA: helix-hairpin-helix domain-containing protein [Nitrospiraceae bacterium]|nr:helix-hairpin-helix domain-containing protein [Nitrospiraceae bacterium]
MIPSVITKLAMLGVTLSVIAWIGWTVPPNQGESGSEAAAAFDQREVAPPLAQGDVVAQPSLPLSRPASPVSSQPRRLTATTHVNLNLATARELDRLPGIGPSLAERIVHYRRSHGPFTALEDLLLVKGIGPKTFDRLRGLVTVRSETSRDNQEGRL